MIILERLSWGHVTKKVGKHWVRGTCLFILIITTKNNNNNATMATKAHLIPILLKIPRNFRYRYTSQVKLRNMKFFMLKFDSSFCYI